MSVSAVLMRLIGVCFFVCFSVIAEPATAQSSSPIKVIEVVGGFLDPANQDYTERVGVSFENVSSQTIVAVKWHVYLKDAFGVVLQTATEDSYGTYAPGVVINPKRAMNGTLRVDQSIGDTNAWDIYNENDNKVTTFGFRVVAAKFSDGTIWTNPEDPP